MTATTIDVVERHMAAERARDADAAAATFTDDCHYFVAPLGLQLRGRDQIREWYAGLFAAVPDYDDIPVDQWYCETPAERFVLYRAEMCGTHRGTWHGWAATGRAFRVPMLVRIPIADDGLMRGEEVFFDTADLFGQLGILPRLGSRTERWGQRLHAAHMNVARRVAR